jgi:hypothetical protein
MLLQPVAIHSTVCEQDLPACMRYVLAEARRSRPGTGVTCVSFHTHEDGREIARLGPPDEWFDSHITGTTSARFRPRNVLVLSVTTTETTFATVRTLTHVLVTLLERRTQN